MEGHKECKKRSRSSEEQMDFLLKFMLENKDFATGKFVNIRGKETKKNMWEGLKNQLNELGPIKSVDQWQKVWKNQRGLARKKNRDLKVSHRRTGNFTPPPPLTDNEEKIIGIIGKTSSQGLGFEEGAFIQQTHIENADFDMTEEEPLETAMESPVVEDVEEDLTYKAPKKKNARLSKVDKEAHILNQVGETNYEGLMAIANALNNVAEAVNNVARELGHINGSLENL